jgi:hypothetical protein
LLLSEFDFKIEYTRGRTRTLADSLSRRPFTQEERYQVEKCQQEVDPLFLSGVSAISEDLLHDMAPLESQIWKSHSRHYRRHAKIMHLAPITLQDIAHPAEPSPDAPQPPLPSADNGPEKVIDFLAFQKLPKDRQEARRAMMTAEHFQIVNDQLVKIAHFQRKHRAQYRPVTTQICAPHEWRLAMMATFHDFLNHANSERCYYTLRDFFGHTNFRISTIMCSRVRSVKKFDTREGKTFNLEKLHLLKS